MNFSFTSKKGNLALALHAVVGSVESHSNLDKLKTQFLYDALETAFGGDCVPKLIHVLHQHVEAQGLKTFEDIDQNGVDNDFDIHTKGYTDVLDFYPLAEVMYLIAVAYNFSMNLYKVGADASKEVMLDYVKACVDQAVTDLLTASRVLYTDGIDYEKMPYIPSDASPIPYLRPMFYMIYCILEADVVSMNRRYLGNKAAESLTSFGNDANQYLLKTCTAYFTEKSEFTY